MSRSETRVFEGEYPVVFRAVCDAALSLTMPIKFADPQAGVIHASSIPTMSSWGEHIQIRVVADGPSRTSVFLQSGLKFGLVDWGKNRKNLEKLYAAIDARLAAGVQVEAAGAWHPDPTGRHELRYWDGTRWTEHVSDAGTTGTDPV